MNNIKTSIILMVILLAGCAPEQQKQLKPSENAIILNGRIVPFEQAEIISPVSAIVNKILVEPGHRVKEGQVLLRLDETTARAEVARGEADVISARAALAEARAGSSEAQRAEAEAEVERLRQEIKLQQNQRSGQTSRVDYEQASIILENAKAKLERFYRLFADRLVSKTEIESAQDEYAEALRRYEASRETFEKKTVTGDSDEKITAARYRAAQARLAGIESGAGSGKVQIAASQVRQAEAELERARYNSGQTVLKAPISGIVSEVMAQVGNKAYEGRALIKIENIARVKVQADLSPGLLPFVRVGQKAEVTINTVPPTKVGSNVTQIQPVADPKTQSLGLTLILSNPDFKFQPGFTARVEIRVDRESAGKRASS